MEPRHSSECDCVACVEKASRQTLFVGIVFA